MRRPPAAGIFRPPQELGARVRAGDPAGAIYAIDDPLRPPVVMEFRRSGMLWALRGQGRTEAGDAAAVVVADQTDP